MDQQGPRRHLAVVRQPDDGRGPPHAPHHGAGPRRQHPLPRRRRLVLPDDLGARRIAARARDALRGDRRRKRPAYARRRTHVDRPHRQLLRRAEGDLGRGARRVAPRHRHRVRRLRRTPGRRLHQLPLPQHRLRRDLDIDRRRPPARAGDPRDRRGYAQSPAPLPRHRVRPVRHARWWGALARAAQRDADRPGQRHGDPAARERPGARHARPRRLDHRPDRCAAGTHAGGTQRGRTHLHDRCGDDGADVEHQGPRRRHDLPRDQPAQRRAHRRLGARRDRRRDRAWRSTTRRGARWPACR